MRVSKIDNSTPSDSHHPSSYLSIYLPAYIYIFLVLELVVLQYAPIPNLISQVPLLDSALSVLITVMEQTMFSPAP